MTHQVKACDTCGIQFPYNTLKNHIKKCADILCEPKYKCNVCDYKSDKKVNVTRHMKSNHGNDVKEKEKEINTCGNCGKNFSLAKYLKAHERTHNEEKPKDSTYHCVFFVM